MASDFLKSKFGKTKAICEIIFKITSLIAFVGLINFPLKFISGVERGLDKIIFNVHLDYKYIRTAEIILERKMRRINPTKYHNLL